MAYLIEFTPEALLGLEQLSQKKQERILRKTHWLIDNFDSLSPTALTGNLSGLFKLRVGDYRVLYTFSEATKTITVHLIGHRSEIYLS